MTNGYGGEMSTLQSDLYMEAEECIIKSCRIGADQVRDVSNMWNMIRVERLQLHLDSENTRGKIVIENRKYIK